MRQVLILMLAASLLAGCPVHTRRPERVLKPEGENVTLHLRSKLQATGELMGLDGESLILGTGSHLAAVPLADVERLTVEGYGRVSPKDRRRIALYARYSEGLTPEQWRLLLAHYGQEDFTDLGDKP